MPIDNLRLPLGYWTREKPAFTVAMAVARIPRKESGEMAARRRRVPKLVGNDNKDATSNQVYVILGTSHQIQCRWGDANPRECQLIDELESAIRRSIVTYKVMLIAEEAPNDGPTLAHRAADQEKLPYLQIDMLSHEQEAYGIRAEMDIRTALSSKLMGGIDYRCCHADDIRENFWLDRIEGNPSASRVLVVCGYAHTKFLAKKVRDRRCTVEGEIFSPPSLEEREIVELPYCCPKEFA